jgi:hypothetical protein
MGTRMMILRLCHDTTDGGSVTASTKAMNTATGYPAVDVQIEPGTATPAHKIAKRVSSVQGTAFLSNTGTR